ncbi:hypothetical protein OG21DRAFT_1498608 [Imleria badia]|nr:hypothetical protein OG21DRAFT_1498608 [Imleria badia]
MYQSGLILSMRWIQGDPASCNSVPANGTFEFVANFSNSTSYRTHTSDHKLTFINVSGYSISIAGNTLSWDDSQSWFNTSLNMNGLNATFASQSIMLDKFSPYACWIIGQLTETLFTGIPMTRGNRFPWGESVLLDAESVLNHMFSVKPLQTLVTNYAIRGFRLSGTSFGDAFIYESSRALNNSRRTFLFVSRTLKLKPQLIEYEAFFLGRAETRGSSFQPYTIYAGTNSALLSVNKINLLNTGIVRVEGQSFTLSPPPPLHLLAMPCLPGTGIVQIYEARGEGILQNTSDLSGEQPPNPNAA